MGNAGAVAAGAPRALELRMAPRSGQLRACTLRVGALDSPEGPVDSPEEHSEASWGRPCVVQLPSEHSAVAIAVHGQQGACLAKLPLPYHCLCELGLRSSSSSSPISLKLALRPSDAAWESEGQLAAAFWEARRLGADNDGPCLEISLRELDDSVPGFDEEGWSLPTARRRLITLELENSALQRRAGAAAEIGAAGCAKQLQLILEENEELRQGTAQMRQEQERVSAVLADAAAVARSKDWQGALAELSGELERCRARRCQLLESCEERLEEAECRLQRAFFGSPEAQLAALEGELAACALRVQEAAKRRDGLARRLQERRSSNGPERLGSGPESLEALERQRDALRQRLASTEEELKGLQGQPKLASSTEEVLRLREGNAQKAAELLRLRALEGERRAEMERAALDRSLLGKVGLLKLGEPRAGSKGASTASSSGQTPRSGA